MTDRVELIQSPETAPPGGHYSAAMAFGDLVFVSGQLPVLADGTHDPAASFEDQARRALGNLLAVVRAAGSVPERVLKVTAYVAGAEHWPAFDRIFAELFGDARPARAVVLVPMLHYGYLVEEEAIAAR
jgi:enamine deaminase RidA (YjgF/YER057c/UK114 family)